MPAIELSHQRSRTGSAFGSDRGAEYTATEAASIHRIRKFRQEESKVGRIIRASVQGEHDKRNSNIECPPAPKVIKRVNNKKTA